MITFSLLQSAVFQDTSTLRTCPLFCCCPHVIALRRSWWWKQGHVRAEHCFQCITFILPTILWSRPHHSHLQWGSAAVQSNTSSKKWNWGSNLDSLLLEPTFSHSADLTGITSCHKHQFSWKQLNIDFLISILILNFFSERMKTCVNYLAYIVADP